MAISLFCKIFMRNALTLLVFFLAFSTTIHAQLPTEIDCGYRLEITAIDKKVKGKLLQQEGVHSHLTQVVWSNAKTGEILGNNSDLSYELPEAGTYTFKVSYQTVLPSVGLGCSSQLEQELVVLEPGCYQAFPGIGNTFCPSVFAPVCGCNGITYPNECEASAAGVFTWWAGECGTQPANCGTTDFSFQVLQGSPSIGYWVRFKNQAAGDFTHIQLDFGDSSQIFLASDWNSRVHHYPEGGIYRATLTAWNINQPGCVSSVTKTFVTDALSLATASLPASTDYVLPGDANGDGKANAYDLLYLSKGYGQSGSPRPEASSDWAPQYAPNWLLETQDGINYKHFDGNGDGAVNESDQQPLEMHYQPLGSYSPMPPAPNTPQIYVQFDQDTLYIDPNDPLSLQITANVLLGTPNQPVENLRGIACALKYPEFVAHDPSMHYDSSFLGNYSSVLHMGRDYHAQHQFDLAVSQKTNTGASGYGKLAEIAFRADYIIIIDIIDREASQILPFVIPVESIKALDASGQFLPISTPIEVDTLWIKVNTTTTSTSAAAAEKTIRLSPNPASHNTLLETGSLDVRQIRIHNSLGQVVLTQVPSGKDQTLLDLTTLEPGIYQLQLDTPFGILRKKLVKG